MFLLLGAVAWAHSPHDVTESTALADDGATLSVDYRGWVMTTGDLGHTWHQSGFLGGAVCGFALAADDAWVLAATSWHSADGGASWDAGDGPAEATGCRDTGTARYAWTETHLWHLGDDGAWTDLGEVPGPLVDLAEDADGHVVAARMDGTLWTLADGTWTEEPDTSGLVAVAYDGATRLTLDTSGTLAVDGVALPTQPEPLRLLAVSAGRWLAAGTYYAPWVSADQGATWTLEPDGIDALATEGDGLPTDGVYWNALTARGGREALSGWYGAYVREAGDGPWSELPIRPLQLARGVAWAGETLLVGSDGGGVYAGTPGDGGFVDASADIDWPWIRRIATATEDTWFVTSGSTVYRTHDAGRTWGGSDVGPWPGGEEVEVSPDWEGDPTVFYGNHDADLGTVVVSHDGGGTYTAHELEGCGEEQRPFALGVGDGGRVWAGCDHSLYRSDDDGDAWAYVGDTPELVNDVSGDEEPWLAVEDGLYRWEDGAAVLVGAEGDSVLDLVEDGEGGAWFVAAGEGVGHADAGGVVSWATLPERDVFDTIARSGGGQLAVGGFTGVWTSADDGATWALATDYDRFDETEVSWALGAGWSAVDADGAKRREWAEGGAGVTATWSGQAAAFELVGQDLGDAEVTVAVDAAAPTTVAVPSALGPFAHRALDPGWHTVTVSVSGGTFALDGLARWREAAPVVEEEPPADDEEACGCAGVPSGGTAVAFLFGLVAVRRRR